MSDPDSVGRDENLGPDAESKKSVERNTFIFLTVFLFPILSVIIVGSYGFIVWMSHIIYGPPGGH
ncbi:periplasmic nitrate reductase, NapE protein [Thalassotalea sp. PS06]|uniref:periplasmic nitrate reductase, NapE protein n=1 Tax=Thalassotalea sp. PS06 TaxID=2594005 RepID=UPI001165239C|nr:periplasmic nitrate reductase, NapE protein [Thalassotalea sp. PS06]QDP00487.1 periplasmic nitrate reductase, NapE protein [Thalassotalea sp. PS06]